ncbi:MAG: hypothetical protein L3K16_03080 [Thermoplasmata archaeon]|nr:hypothetical protein [Thermoplasmata archaeon]
MSVAARRPGVPRWLPIAVGFLVALSGAVASVPAPSAGPAGSVSTRFVPFASPLPVPAASAPIAVTLTVNSTSANLSSQFWGTTVNNEVRMFRGETNAVNATPAKVLVWPGAMAGEDYDPFTQTHYNTYDGTPTHALTNESQFVQMCEAIHCTAIVQVPAEIDNPSIAEAIVNYTEVNLSFTPAYWMIGNEPELWEHWKVPWADWASETTNGPDPNQFGHEVVSYVKAIRAVDTTTPILGLPASGCTCGYYTFDQWISGVLNVTGSKIQAVAFHEYPAGWLGTGNGSLQAFYGTLQGAAGIPVRVAAARAAVQLACPGCNVSVFISELGSALSWSSYGPYAIGFSGALSLASQVTQAMDVNLTNLDLFATELATTNSWFNTTGGARPDYALYTGVLDHLGTEAFPATLPGLDRTVYGIDTLDPRDHDREDLLVMNDNITHAISFTPQFAGSFGGSAVEAWSWNGSIHSTRSNDTTWVEPYTPQPVPQDLPSGLPETYTLPPQSLVLFESYPSGGSYVRVLNTGVPNGTAWYANVAGEFYSTTANNVSLLLPPGAYPVASVPIPLPIDGREVHPSEQLAPFVASPIHVDGASTNVTLSFVDQWRLNVSAAPGDAGSVTPDVGWWNSGEPVTLTATPLVGYAFAGWSGWGPGSANGSSRSITIDPTGPVSEKARFVVGDEVELWAFGLPKGTPWSVTVRGFTTTSTNTTLAVYEPFGSYGFTVAPVPGYRTLPANGGFTVDSSWSLVEVRFVLITPPPPVVPVTFRVSGLPAATPVAITVRNSTETAGADGAVFRLANGSYAYHVGYVAGYHADVAEKTFDVLGGGLTVDVPFVPTTYPVTWQAAGTRTGLNWTVRVDGQSDPATTAWLSTSLPNGSYAYAIELPSNYSATPRTGVVVVHGFSAVLPVTFSLLEFRAWFDVSGAPASTDWSMRFGNLTHAGASNGSSFLAANGTYTFDVDPPAGYFAVPSHGTRTVAGPDPPTEIQFHPTSNRPSAALVAALSSGALWTSIWIGLSVFAGFVAVRGLRRRDGGRR